MKSVADRRNYAWSMVAMLWVVALLNYLDRLLISSMHDPIKASIPMTEAQFGLLTSAFLWVYGVLSPLGGYVADQFGRKWVIVFSLFVWSALTLWTGYVTSFNEMIIVRALMGISEACYIPAALALITDYHKNKTRSLAIGIHMSGLYAGMALGGIGGYIAEWFGWRYGFHLFGAMGILYAFVLLYFVKDAPTVPETEQKSVRLNSAGEKVNISDSLKKLFGTYSFYILLLYNSVIGMAFWLIYTWLPTFLRENFNLKLGQAGVSATGYIQIASFLGVIVGGFLADRWSKSNNRARIVLPVVGFTIGAPFLFLLATTQVFLLAILGMIIFGLARGFHDSNLMPILCQVIDHRYRATGYGFLNLFSTLVGGISIYWGGILKDNHVNLALIFQISAATLLFSSWLLLLVKIRSNGSVDS